VTDLAIAGATDELVAFLSSPDAYAHRPDRVEAIETHMSLVFIAGDLVFKMKKPVRLAFVDFTTLEARRENCERELALNQGLAPGVYREVVPVVRTAAGTLSIGGSGEPVEWLLVMQKLDRERLLGAVAARGEAKPADIDGLCDRLAGFYCSTARIPMTEEELLSWWKEAVDSNVRSLDDLLFDLPRGPVEDVLSAELDFLDRHADLLTERAREGRILDGHGDLRPEHVHLGPPLRLIDRLEFNARLRWVDAFDEAAYLGLECSRLGADWIGPRLIDGLSERLGDRPSGLLIAFYTCHRAAMRARLSIEHMRDPNPRTPERWPRQAREYLDLACATLRDLVQ